MLRECRQPGSTRPGVQHSKAPIHARVPLCPKTVPGTQIAGHWVVGQDFRSPAWAALGWGTSIHQAALSFHTSFSLSGFLSVSVYLIGYNKLLTTLCRLSSPILSNTLSSAPKCTPFLQEPTYQQEGSPIVLQADQGL